MSLLTPAMRLCLTQLQVRNLRSSIKVALDFVSPDAVGECLELRQEFRCGGRGAVM